VDGLVAAPNSFGYPGYTVPILDSLVPQPYKLFRFDFGHAGGFPFLRWTSSERLVCR